MGPPDRWTDLKGECKRADLDLVMVGKETRFRVINQITVQPITCILMDKRCAAGSATPKKLGGGY